MIIKSFELFKFQIPLKDPLKISNTSITNREGLILKLCDDKNNIGFGEISPLPGLHKENIRQVIKQLKKYLSLFIEKKMPNSFVEVEWQMLFKNLNLFPTVQFGIESALISLIAAKQCISVIDLFNSSTNQSILVNALLTGKHDEIVIKINKYLKKGFTVFKLKVGRNTINKDINFVNKICSILKNKAKLRLDVNRAWAFSEALHFFQNIDVSKIEYIEDPLRNFNELPNLFKKTKIPIALDEPIPRISTDDLPPCYVKAIVIKPTMIGTIERSIQLIRYAENNNIMPVLSDTFQSGIGLSMLIAIATIIKKKNIAMGFDTYSWLKEDILVEKLNFKRNKITVGYFPHIDLNENFSTLSKI